MVKKKIEPHEIQNKMRRLSVLDKRKIEKKKIRKEHRKKVKSGEIEKQDPNTQENMRILTDDIILEKDEDLNEEENFDEFSQFIKSLKTPKIFITSNLKPTRFTFDFLIEIKNLLPNAHYYPRNKQTLPNICKAALKKDFTHLLMINERLKKPWSLSFTVLGTGPTLTFRIRKYVPTYQIFNKGNATGHYPELILKNFNTALGRRVARGIGSLFPSQPEFKGRTVVTFHNQRDFIFFRHHRYIFKKKEHAESDKIEDKVKINLQEIGPRFVLQLQKIYQSNFDEFQGQSEFLYRADYYQMRTMIRLQNKFHRNNHTYKIIVQGKNQNLRGDYIEHIGWWLPQGTKTQERSILINKYRARYWISVGTQFDTKVQRFFSFVGMAQSPWIKFGSKTLYKEPKEVKHKRWQKGLTYFIKKSHNMLQEQKMGEDEIKEIQAQYFRKFKLEESLGDYLNNEIEVDNLLGETKQKTENDNDLIRTEKYKVLKKFYDSVEQGKVFIDEHKKQILFDKLKELFEQGVHSDKFQNYTAMIKGKEYHYKDLEKIFREQYKELKQNRIVKTELFKQQFVPITQEETQQLFMKYQRLNLRQAIKKTREIFEEAKDINKTILRFHIIGLIQEEKIRKEIGYAEQEGQENIVIDDVMEPELSLLTPPDLEEYDPKDWYDLNKVWYGDLTPASKDHSRLLDRPKTRAYLNYKDDIEREQKKLIDTDSKEFKKEMPKSIQYAFYDTFKDELGLNKKNTIY